MKKRIRRRSLVTLGLAFALTAVAGTAVAFASRDTAGLASAKSATAPFRSVKAAEQAGYAELRDAKHIACIAQPGEGAMGIHYVNGTLVKDAILNPQRPEALVYEPSGNSLRLVALEYIVFAKAWQKTTPPAMFGRTFDYVGAPNRYGLPAFWALHAWVWKSNPAGTVMAWNTRVSC
jgi:hypothetical protein